MFRDQSFDPDSFVHNEPQRFWCDECDEYLIDSTDPTTGKFFSQFGLRYTYNRTERCGVVGEWTQVIYAVCSHCLEENENAQ